MAPETSLTRWRGRSAFGSCTDPESWGWAQRSSPDSRSPRRQSLGVMDADFSHPPPLVPRLLATFNVTSADVVVGSRYIAGGSTPSWPLKRRVLSRIACLLARPLSPIRDPASGFFLIRRDVAGGVAIKAGGFKILLELLVRAWPRRLVEVPYQFDDRELGVSKMSFAKRPATSCSCGTCTGCDGWPAGALAANTSS